MKNLLAATILLVYAVSSGGIVLIEYSCHETGTSGVTVPAPRSCYAPACGDEEPGEADACCDHECCEIDIRLAASDDQITSGPNDPAGDAATTMNVQSAVSLSDAVIADATPLGAPPPLFPGHNRPIRI